MNVEITPSRLSGAVAPPSSKSVAHRALIAAACADSPCLLTGKTEGDDVFATLSCLNALGANIEKTERGLLVHPISAPQKKAVLNVGASGSTFRFMLPLCASLGTETTFLGTERLASRPIGDLLGELKKHGLGSDGDKIPFTVKNKIHGGEFTIKANVSSQYITGLLLALPLLGGGTIDLIGDVVSKDYLQITLSVMRAFGVTAAETENGFTVSGTYRSPKTFSIESDWSSAGFFTVAGAKGDVLLQNLSLSSAQGDKGILDAVRLSGGRVETDGGIRVSQNKNRAFAFNVEHCPDAAPILSVLAAFGDGKSRLTGTARLKLKESDRSAEILRMLDAFSIQATDFGDSIEIVGGKLKGCSLVLPDDHRICMAAAIAATYAEGKTVLYGAECVNKSYPSFFEDFVKLGGKIHVLTV